MNDGLRRDLGLLDAVGIGMGAIVGAGIFVVTGIAAGVAGPSFLVGLLIAGCVAAANALSSAQLAAVYPQTGGSYEYGYELLGPRTGFVAGCAFIISKIAAAGTVALGLGAYQAELLPALPPRTAAVAAIVVFTALNAFGVRRSSRVNLLIVATSVGTLLTFVVLGLRAFDSAHLTPLAPAGLPGVLRSAALLFFAYTGYARIATLGGEVRNPARTIPRAIVLTIAGALLLYGAVGVAAAGAVSARSLGDSAAPLAIAARATGVRLLPPLVCIGALAAMLGVILSQVLGLSRMVYAMSQRRDLPAPLAVVDVRHGVPRRAVLLVGTAAALTATFGTLAGVASAASFSILVYYAITNAAALRLPETRRRYPRAVPGFGLCACSALALAVPIAAMASTLLLLGSALLLRSILRRH